MSGDDLERGRHGKPSCPGPVGSAQTVVITGASAGIGRATARLFGAAREVPVVVTLPGEIDFWLMMARLA